MLGLEITRTANAGVLLEIDGIGILLDGVCDPYAQYMGTTEETRKKLITELPDAVAFTHKHPDHYDEEFSRFYEENTKKSVFSPENMPNGVSVGAVKLSSFPTIAYDSSFTRLSQVPAPFSSTTVPSLFFAPYAKRIAVAPGA